MMNAISKPFAALATSFRHKPFLKARFKLTAFYILGMTVPLVIFNLGVYGLFVSDVPDAFEDKMPAKNVR